MKHHPTFIYPQAIVNHTIIVEDFPYVQGNGDNITINVSFPNKSIFVTSYIMRSKVNRVTNKAWYPVSNWTIRTQYKGQEVIVDQKINDFKSMIDINVVKFDIQPIVAENFISIYLEGKIYGVINAFDVFGTICDLNDCNGNIVCQIKTCLIQNSGYFNAFLICPFILL